MKKNWRFIFYCLNYFIICSKFRAVSLFLSTAWNWHVEHVLHTFFVEQLTFFCRADDFFKKSVEQSRFEQLHFEQLTLTHLRQSPFNKLQILIEKETLLWNWRLKYKALINRRQSSKNYLDKRSEIGRHQMFHVCSFVDWAERAARINNLKFWKKNILSFHESSFKAVF